MKEYKLEDIIKSVQLGTSLLGSEQNVGQPLLKMGNLTIGGFNFDKLERLQEYSPIVLEPFILKYGDFLFNTRNTLELVGKSAVWRNQITNAVFNSNIMRIKFNENLVDDFYLGYYFSMGDGWFQLKRITTGTTSVAAIYTRDLFKCKLTLPPLPQQQKIAKILTTCDEVIEKTEAAIAKYKAIKQGMMQDLFTRGIDVSTGKLRPSYQEVPELYKESELGMIPKEWEVKRLEKIAILQGGYAFSSNSSSENGVKWLKISNVGFNSIKWDDISYLPNNFIEEYPDFVLKENDLVMAMTRPIIRSSLKVSSINKIDLPLILNQRVGRFIFSDQSNSGFVKYLLQYDKIISQIEIEILGTDPPNVSSNQVNKIKIPLPIKNERIDIGNRIQVIDEKLQSEESSLSKYKKLKEGLMQDLLTGKV